MIVLSYVRFVFHYCFTVSVFRVVLSPWSMKLNPRSPTRIGGYDLTVSQRYLSVCDMCHLKGLENNCESSFGQVL